MKRIILVVLLALTLLSCSNVGSNSTFSTSEAPNSSKSNVRNSGSLQRENNSNLKMQSIDLSTEAAYRIKKASYLRTDVKVYYPQIVNLTDSNKQKTINETIRREALGDIPNSPIDEGGWHEVDYTIKWKSANLLSVEYVGSYFTWDTNHPNNILSTTNIDLNTGQTIKLKDVVFIDENLVDEFRRSNYTKWDPDIDLRAEGVMDSIQDDLTSKQLIEHFKNSDSEKSGYDTYCYFTKDSLGISLGVPHAYGGHVEFEMKYKDIKRNVKADSPVWVDFVANRQN